MSEISEYEFDDGQAAEVLWKHASHCMSIEDVHRLRLVSASFQRTGPNGRDVRGAEVKRWLERYPLLREALGEGESLILSSDVSVSRLARVLDVIHVTASRQKFSQQSNTSEGQDQKTIPPRNREETRVMVEALRRACTAPGLFRPTREGWMPTCVLMVKLVEYADRHLEIPTSSRPKRVDIKIWILSMLFAYLAEFYAREESRGDHVDFLLSAVNEKIAEAKRVFRRFPPKAAAVRKSLQKSTKALRGFIATRLQDQESNSNSKSR